MGGRLSTHSSLLFSRTGNGRSEIRSLLSKDLERKCARPVGLRPNALLLSAAAAAGIECVQPVFSFFQSGMAYCVANALSNRSSPYCLDQFKNRDTFFEASDHHLIRYADFGISDVKSVPANIPLGYLGISSKKQMKTQIGMLMRESSRKHSTSKTQHSCNSPIPAKIRPLPASVWITSPGAPSPRCRSSRLPFVSYRMPTVTLIDEIDTSLHPTLVAGAGGAVHRSRQRIPTAPNSFSRPMTCH